MILLYAAIVQVVPSFNAGDKARLPRAAFSAFEFYDLSVTIYEELAILPFIMMLPVFYRMKIPLLSLFVSWTSICLGQNVLALTTVPTIWYIGEPENIKWEPTTGGRITLKLKSGPPNDLSEVAVIACRNNLLRVYSVLDAPIADL